MIINSMLCTRAGIVLMVDDMVDVNEAHLCVDCSVRREMRPLDIVSLPGYERLTASEKEVCA